MAQLLRFTEWALLEAEDFKVYLLQNRPNHRYRRAGKDSLGNPKWQYQEKKALNKEEWTWVQNKETIKALTAQYLNNLKKSASSAKKTTQTSQVSTGSKDYWTLITIIACENYPDQSQGMADVAQSIYNRFNVTGQPYGKTISEIILGAGQYEPVTVGKARGAQWNAINSKNAAIQVYLKTKGVTQKEAESAINTAIDAQKNPTLIKNAKIHVGSRTEFLATTPSSPTAKGAIERKPVDRNNVFFWNYSGKTNYYDKKLLTATSRPSSVSMS